jgi:hypothetical protein
LNPNKYFIVVCLVASVGCSKTESDKTPVARIDNMTLALEEIRAHIDTAFEPSQVQIQQYVQQWLTEESLYREAVERGLDRSDDMNKKIEEVRRQLTINALLDKEVYARQLTTITSSEIQQYYDEHVKEFKLMNDIALVSYVLFRGRDSATKFRNDVLKGTPWSTAVVQQASSISVRVDSSYRTQATLMPAELWRVAARLTTHELSFPVHTDKGYYVLVVWRAVPQGQTADLPIVEEEIRGRLIVERRRKLFEQLVQNLRAKHAIEVFVNTSPDTGKMKREE